MSKQDLNQLHALYKEMEHRGNALVALGQATGRQDAIALGSEMLREAGVTRMAANIGWRGYNAEQGIPYSSGKNSEAGHLHWSMKTWREGYNLQQQQQQHHQQPHFSGYQTPYGILYFLTSIFQ